MTQRIKVADLPEFDAAPYLDSEASIAAYLTDILEANDPALLAAALGDIARARGMSEIAKARSEEHTSELQSRTKISYAVFCVRLEPPPSKTMTWVPRWMK